MSGAVRDAALARARDERRLAAAVRARPWRDVVAALAARDPRQAGRVTDPGGAAVLALLPLETVAEALVVGDVWAAVAVPLARHCRVRALLPTPAAAAISAAVAAQEGAPLLVCSGDAGAPPGADGSLDLVVVQGGATLSATPVAALRALRRLLRPRGALYVAGANALAALVQSGGDADEPGWSLAEYRALFAAAGLVERRAYACFPHYAAPRDLVPLALVAAHVASRGDAGRDAQLARAGIAEHLVPAFAFLLAPAAAEDAT